MKDAINSEYLICPHCRKINHDAWEYNLSSNPEMVECEQCGKYYRAWSETITIYHSMELL